MLLDPLRLSRSAGEASSGEFPMRIRVAEIFIIAAGGRVAKRCVMEGLSVGLTLSAHY